MKRLCDTPFPPYKFLPGKAQHPEKVGGYLHGKDIEAELISEENYQSNDIYLYAIDLFNNQYYWEAHVYWESLWHKVGRSGEYGDFLKALIKVAAAGVKFDLQQPNPANDHLKRAIELLTPMSGTLFGIKTKDLIEKINSIKNNQITFQLEISTH